jgi:hypothetical protein
MLMIAPLSGLHYTIIIYICKPILEVKQDFDFKYDIVPATELGCTTVWVNRQGEARPMDVKETFLVGDMRTLAYLVKGIAASG